MLAFLRLIGFLEGISYIVLLGVCMPLKYILEVPHYTRPVGMAHGILFIGYCFLVLLVAKQYKWSFLNVFWALIASLLPFGTFVADKKLFRR